MGLHRVAGPVPDREIGHAAGLQAPDLVLQMKGLRGIMGAGR